MNTTLLIIIAIVDVILFAEVIVLKKFIKKYNLELEGRYEKNKEDLLVKQLKNSRIR